MHTHEKRPSHTWLVRGVGLFGLMLVLVAIQTIPAAQARRSFRDAALGYYPQIVGSRLDSCNLCYANESGLNNYGRDYRNSGRDFASIEGLDSDGDGVSNIDEIVSLTLPGDPGDIPGATGDMPPTEPAPAPPAAVVTPPIAPGESVPRLSLERIDARFQQAWERGGGLSMYGLPLTDAYTTEAGLIVQYFERARFEYHSEHANTPNEILLGLLGLELGQTQPPAPPPNHKPGYALVLRNHRAHHRRTIPHLLANAGGDTRFWLSHRGSLYRCQRPVGTIFWAHTYGITQQPGWLRRCGAARTSG